MSFLPIKAMKSIYMFEKTSKSGSRFALSSSKEILQSNKINVNEIVKQVEKEHKKDRKGEEKKTPNIKS